MQKKSNQQRAVQVAEIKKEIYKYSRYWYVFLISVVIAVILVQLKLRYTAKEYTTVSKIKILDKGKGLELPSAALIFNRSNINLDNEIELLKSYDVLEKVVDRTDLTSRWYDQGSVLTTEITNLPFKVQKKISNKDITYRTIKVKINTNSLEVLNAQDETILVLPDYTTKGLQHNLPFEIYIDNRNQLKDQVGKVYVVNMVPIAAAANKLKNDLKVEITGKSSDVLQLSLNSSNAERSEDILRVIHQVFNEDGMNDRQLVLNRTLDFIDERFSILVNELDTIEINKKDFKVENKFISPETDLQLGMSSVLESERGLFEMDSQLLLARFLKDELKKDIKELTLLPSNLGLEGANVNMFIESYNTLIQERDNLDVSAGANNPSVLQIEKSIKDLQENMIASIEGSINQLELMKSNLQQRDLDINRKMATIPEKERLFRDIERQQKIKETLYLFLFQKREEAAINLAITEPSIKIIEEPLSYRITNSLNESNALPMAFAIGFFLPFALFYILFLLDTKLHTKQELIEINPDIPVIAEIPLIKKNTSTLFNNPNDHSVLAESFRVLSSNVDFLLPIKGGEKGKVVYCTSTIKGEGKTYVSMNLSLALSSLNKKVLLIGADLRNPQLHTLINEDKNKPGLSNYLHDLNFNWKDVLVNAFEKHPQHDILLSGSIPPNPAHLLTNGRFEALIEAAKQEYDYIIVDTAPTILVTDTMLISKWADVTVYITRANFTEKELLNFSKELFESGKLKNIAYVLNAVDLNKSYGYGYNYGYNYGYGSEA